MPAFLAPLAIKLAPAILGGLGSLFGRKKKNESMIPDWFKPYLDSMQQNAGRYGEQIDDIQGKNPIRKGLRHEAMAAMGKGKYAAQGYGKIGETALESLRMKQATNAKAGDMTTRMNFAASGIGSGLLPAVLAQQAAQREQGNELANAEAQSNIALGSISAYNNLVNTERDQVARLTGMEGNAYGNIAQLAGAQGNREQARQDAQPGIMSSIMSGLSSAAPGILQGLNGGGLDGINVGDSPLSMSPSSTSNITAEGYGSLSHIPRSQQPVTPTDMADRSMQSAIPTGLDDWLEKYYKPNRKQIGY